MSGQSFTSAAREAMSRLRSGLAARRSPPPPPAILPGLDTRPAPMRPLRPPAAVNDNPLATLEAEVERDLRAHGYLR
ncbi:hypothetical protein [Methylobacterium sp. J-076]|uniref:hypothetical protein n=1 Tax=Methylobacterium sp. J-076 TaxID=2836655 RepID=UPI001FBA6A86|nr:hypothetical protein [Methylobacterium sp. J-076]MCJ2011720.1 hypothetical protein [Methylobacterium sp. J-076]